MELRQLEYFQMASRLRSITRAAERLHVSQPSITKAIKKLEAELDSQLLDRSQKVLELTPEGTLFLSRIELALQSIEDAVCELNDYKNFQKGAIKVGIPPMIGSYLFPKIFFQFRQCYPNLEFSIQEEGSMAILERLEKGELDLGIAIVNCAADSLHVSPMATQQILACLPKQHPLADGRSSIAFPDLDDQPIIMLKDDSYHRQVIMAEFKKHNLNPHIILSSSQIETIKGLVTSGTGIAFFLDAVVRKDSSLIALPLAEPLFAKIGLAWKKEKYLSRASRVFIDFIMAHHELIGS